MCFEDAEQGGSGVFIGKDDTSTYARALTEVLRALEKYPEAAKDLGVFELTAMKNLGALLKSCASGSEMAPQFDLRRLIECLKTR